MPQNRGNNNNGRRKSSSSNERGSKRPSFKPSKTYSKDSTPAPKKVAKETDEIRLNKYIANSGICSRREADLYITSGNVKVNGIPVTELGYKVQPTDVVNFDGRVLVPEKKIYILLNKPKNFTTSEDGTDKSVFELIKHASKYPLTPIGRMDKNTTGLLVLTNDNDMIAKFARPNQRSTKIYHVSLSKNLKFEDLESISGGVQIEERRLSVDEVTYIDHLPKTEIGIQLRTANVKVVRNIFEKFGYDVLKVDRVSFAGLTKKNLPRGQWRPLTQQEIVNLMNF